MESGSIQWDSSLDPPLAKDNSRSQSLPGAEKLGAGALGSRGSTAGQVRDSQLLIRGGADKGLERGDGEVPVSVSAPVLAS